MKSPAADAFRQRYTELQMERDGLFAAVARVSLPGRPLSGLHDPRQCHRTSGSCRWTSRGPCRCATRVSSNHQGDAGQAAIDAAYRLLAVIHEQQARHLIDRE
jgi:hypothetical protein